MSRRTNASLYLLRDSPFFRLRTKKNLAKLLRVSKGTLQSITSREDLYKRSWKHKKEGKWLKEKPPEGQGHLYRPIDIPDFKIKEIQSRIANLLGRITPPNWLFSPVKGRSYVDNAAYHRGSKAFWFLDIADYFPSCNANNVAHFFRQKLECSPDVTAILVKLTTWQQCLPQGSPCSPILAYFSNMNMWNDISALVLGEGLKLSVYADDITISGPLVRKAVIWKIKQAIHKNGLRVKREKELSLIHSPADITGVIVANNETRLPNRQLKRLLELRKERQVTKDKDLKKILDAKIFGREVQRRQVEKIT